MRRILCILLLCTLLIQPVFAREETLESVMADFMAENYLSSDTFSMSYYNTVTGERYTYNDEAFMVAASTFKLPLNMYYYELERDGALTSDAYIAKAGTTLDVIHRESLVNSNNEMSLALLYTIGEFPVYKETMRKYFTMTDDEIAPIYFQKNYYCTRMMMDALQYLYDHSAEFEEMLGYMKQAQPEQYFRTKVTECEIAHKYGWYDGAVNDVGIFYTEEPFLLAVYTQNVAGEQVVADIAQVLTDYNIRHTTQPPEEPEEPETQSGIRLEVEMKPLHPQAPEPEAPAPQPEPEPVPEPAAEEEPSAFAWWMPVVALGVFAVGGGASALIFRTRHMKMWQEEEEE